MEEYNEGVFSFQAPDFEQPLEGSGWRLAKSLVILRNEINKKAPNRRKDYDGTIGDTSHAARASRHNPNSQHVVCAMDITHDPAHGMDTYALSDFLRTHPHKDLEYVISNKRIASRTSGWTSRKYTGSSPHSGHIHIAVGRGPDSNPTVPYDDTNSWGISSTPIPDPGGLPYGRRIVKLESPYMQGMDILWICQQMNKLATYPQGVTQHLKETETYNEEVANCVGVFQFRFMGSKDPDKIVGPLTWKALRRETNNL